MRKFFSAVLLLAAAGGVIWFESRPTTVKIPVETSDEIAYQDELTTTTEAPATTQPRRHEVDFSKPDVIMDVKNADGDHVVLTERIGKPQQLDQLPAEVRNVALGCMGVTERDMAVRIDSRVESKSSLAMTVGVNYHTLGHMAVFEYSSGTQCEEGQTTFELGPGDQGRLTYWVMLHNVVTPDHPDGDLLNGTWSLDGLGVALPNYQGGSWTMTGPHVVDCHDPLGDSHQIWIAGLKPSC